MAALDQLGITLQVGGQTSVHGATLTSLDNSYIIESVNDGGVDGDFIDTDDEDGKLTNRTILKRHPKFTANLVAKSDAVPLTDFPDKAMCVISGMTSYFINSCSIDRTKGPTKVSVELQNIGIS